MIYVLRDVPFHGTSLYLCSITYFVWLKDFLYYKLTEKAVLALTFSYKRSNLRDGLLNF